MLDIEFFFISLSIKKKKKRHFHWPLTCMVSNEKSVVIPILNSVWSMSLQAVLKIFCMCMFYFTFLLVLYKILECIVWYLLFWLKKLTPIISSDISSDPFSLVFLAFQLLDWNVRSFTSFHTSTKLLFYFHFHLLNYIIIIDLSSGHQFFHQLYQL